MKNLAHIGRTIAAAVVFASAAASASASVLPVDGIFNGGFQASTLASGTFDYLNGTYNSWTYTGSSGIATNNSAFNLVNAAGGQAGLLQQVSSISQAFTFTQSLFSVSFSAEARNYGGGGNIISVLVDGVALNFGGQTSFIPGSNSSFTTYTSDLIKLSVGTHTLNFVSAGVAGKDVTTFIDNVSVSAVPEPLSISLMGLGMLALGASRRKNGKKA
jgi:hypothetical protein